MIEKIKGVFKSHGVALGSLCVIYIAGWIAKALYGYNFDLPEFRQFIIWIGGYLLSIHGINSGLNTQFGSNKPKEETKT